MILIHFNRANNLSADTSTGHVTCRVSTCPEFYLGGGEDDTPDQLRLCEHLNLLNDPGSLINQSHSVEEPRLWKPERDMGVSCDIDPVGQPCSRLGDLLTFTTRYHLRHKFHLFSCRQSS